MRIHQVAARPCHAGYSDGSWYRRTEAVSGPRVIETFDGKVVDNIALPDEDRLLLSGKSKDYVEKLQAQKDHESPARHDLIRE
jgi:hypothetical protein